MLFLWVGALGLVAAGAALNRRLPLPDAVIWCGLGFAAAFFPGYDHFRVDARLTLYLFLPPLVYASSVRLPWPAFRDSWRPISVLAVWLVLANTVAVAAVSHAVAGFSWAAAAVLGAVISPTDPVAVTALAARVGLPRKLIAILEGEGLVNDAVALTLLRLALAAATGAFSAVDGLLRFIAVALGEPLYGWAVAVGIMRLRTRIEDPRIEITVSLITPFVAYLVPEYLGGSGILATVAAGMYVGERRSALVPAGTRLHSTSVWEIVVFLLNGLLFLMAGIELRRALRPEYLHRPHFLWGAAAAGAVIAVRALWCAAMWLLFRRRRMLRYPDGRPMPARQMLVIAWSGMRGPVSLAAALSLPGIAPAARLPEFDAVVFITAIVIGATLVIQGVSLPRVAAASGVSHDAEADRREEAAEIELGESAAARAAMKRLEQLESRGQVAREVAAALRRSYAERANFEAGSSAAALTLIEAERARLYELRREGRIQDDALRQLERALDLRESAIT